MNSYLHTIKPPFYITNFDYFRLPPERWSLYLTRLAQVGIQGVVLPLPWLSHETVKGQVDFTGAVRPRHDVITIIKLCAALNLTCLLAPGPIHPDQGLLNDGLPLWLPPEPVSMEAVTGWYSAVSKALAPYQWPQGPVVALWLTLESERIAASPRSQQLAEVKWPLWLRKQYGGLEELNAALNTHYESLRQIEAPENAADTPLAEDARLFLQKVQEAVTQRVQLSMQAGGWQVPIYPFDWRTDPSLPPLSILMGIDDDEAIFLARDLIQIDPNPPDVGATPAWAAAAPIRPDGSVRRSYWSIRQHLWPYRPDEDGLLSMPIDGGKILTAGQDIAMNLPLPKGEKPNSCRLEMTGNLVDENFTTARARLKGTYLTETDTAQTDLVFYLTDPTQPLDEKLAGRLALLLKAQILSMKLAAKRAEQLGQQLAPGAPAPAKTPPGKSRATAQPAAIAEAKRGLREAEAALRKAIASVGGLDAGFDTLLGKEKSTPPQPVTEPTPITPDAFDEPIRSTLLATGQVCRTAAASLRPAAETLQSQLLDGPGLTVALYRDYFAGVTAAAQTSMMPLQETLTRLRLETAAEELPLVTWRIHNQVQAIVEELRWGVLRGR
jgi:hypothetical protein